MEARSGIDVTTHSSRLLTRIAVLGLASFLVALSGFTIWVGQATQQAGDDARRVSAVSGLYQHLGAALATEAAAQREFWLIASPATLEAFRQAGTTVSGDLAALTRAGGPRDRLLAERMGAAQRTFTHQTERFYRVLQTGEDAAAATIDLNALEPELKRMSDEVNRAATQEDRKALRGFTALGWQTLVVRAGSMTLFLLGLGFLGLVWLVLRFYRRRVEEAQAVERNQLERAAVTDSITGLGNHRAFHEALQREVSRSIRHKQVLSLALVDVDDFKVINDQHGHSHGDRVLVQLASCFAGHRLEDQPFRLGGDEFAVLLPSVDSGAATASMDRLRGQAEHRLFGATVSIGIAQLDPETEDEQMDAETLREMADAALYEAKRRGRNAVVTFDEIRASASIVSTRHINAVRRLLAERDLSIAFQPIWDVQRRVLIGYEALMRPATHYGLNGPQDAFDIAEKLGRASELDEICRDSILADAPPLPPGVCLFINVSPASLDHPRFGDEALKHAVAAAGLMPAQIVFEITERAVARAEMVVREAKRLRAAGFRLALDDVGAGNAGLEVLRHVPVDFVKIDRGVVSEALVDASAAAVLTGIVAFARKANTFVIAEGIETPAMLEMIDRIMRPSDAAERAIQGAQGYLLGKPQSRPLDPDKPRVQTQIRRTETPETRAG